MWMPNELFVRMGYCDMNLKMLVLLLLLPCNVFVNGSKKLEFEPVRNVVMNITLKNDDRQSYDFNGRGFSVQE